MLDIKNLESSIYKFSDGDLIISTRPLTMSIITEVNSSALSDEEKVDLAFKSMLYEEDFNRYKDYDPTVKAILVTEWVEFHTKRLQDRFPSSGSTEQ